MGESAKVAIERSRLSAPLFPGFTLFFVFLGASLDAQFILLETPLPRRLVLLSLDDIVRSERRDRKSTRLNSSHVEISYAVFCLKKKKKKAIKYRIKKKKKSRLI